LNKERRFLNGNDLLLSMSAEPEKKDLLILENQQCPVCGVEKASFSEYEIEDPYAGTLAIFAIKCLACGFKNSDLEFLNPAEPAEYSVEIESKEDLDIRVIKSGSCEIKIPNFRISVDASMSNEGFISNVEGVITRFRQQIELLKNDSELEKEQRKKLKNLLKGIDEVLRGDKKITLKLRDDTGNSAIISDKVQVKKLKKSK
jgi:zinc finger protein